MQYSGRDIDTLEPEIDKTVLELVDLVRTKYHARPLDLSKISICFTLDVLTRIAFGNSIGNLKADEDVYGFSPALTTLLPIAELGQNHLFFYNLLQLLQKVITPPEDVGFGKFAAIARDCVKERFGPEAKKREKNDMLVSVLCQPRSQRRTSSMMVERAKGPRLPRELPHADVSHRVTSSRRG